MHEQTQGASESSPWEIKVGLKMRPTLHPLTKMKREFSFVSPEDHCSDGISLGQGQNSSMGAGAEFFHDSQSTSVKNCQKNTFAALPCPPWRVCEIRRERLLGDRIGAHACSQVFLEVCKDLRVRGSMGREGGKG